MEKPKIWACGLKQQFGTQKISNHCVGQICCRMLAQVNRSWGHFLKCLCVCASYCTEITHLTHRRNWYSPEDWHSWNCKSRKLTRIKSVTTWSCNLNLMWTFPSSGTWSVRVVGSSLIVDVLWVTSITAEYIRSSEPRGFPSYLEILSC